MRLRVVLFVFFVLNNISGERINEDLVITWEQKVKLDEFRTIMESQLPHDYTKKDIYLIRWLKVRGFSVPAAARMLRENLRWREENEMDTVLEEDWTEFNNQYRYNVDGCDDNGTPVAVLFVGEWDMRRAVLAGQSDKMRRYIDKLFEEVTTVLRNMQAHGSNATRALVILDCASLSFQVQACPRCIPFYIYLVQTMGAHFPNLFKIFIVINTPDIVIPIWTNIIKPASPPELQNNADVYGRKRSVWREAFMTKYGIDWTKMSQEMGGDGPDPVDSNDLRKSGYSYECPGN